MSMPVDASYGVYDTKQCYKLDKINLGTAHNTELNGAAIQFEEVLVEDYDEFDERNLVFCCYLNLRNS